MINILKLSMEANSQLINKFQTKAVNIDKMAEWACENQNNYLLSKYRNIEATISILRSLIQKFNKKSENYQTKMRKTARIEDIAYQTQFHKKRLEQCEELSKTIIETIQNKRHEIAWYEQEANKLRKKLIMIKTDSIKTIIKIQELEQQERIVKQKNAADLNRAFKKEKINQKRSMLLQRVSVDPLERVKREKDEMQYQLFKSIDDKVKTYNFVGQCYDLLREKLQKQERKSTVFGLSGSMLFKLQKENFLNSQNIRRLQLNNPKLMIYDILKQKHLNYKANTIASSQKVQIEKSEFLQFSPLQIAGVIQLKGGFSKIRNKKITHSKTEYLINKVKREQNQENLNQVN